MSEVTELLETIGRQISVVIPTPVMERIDMLALADYEATNVVVRRLLLEALRARGEI